jgi:hypothetical protein
VNDENMRSLRKASAPSRIIADALRGIERRVCKFLDIHLWEPHCCFQLTRSSSSSTTRHLDVGTAYMSEEVYCSRNVQARLCREGPRCK